MTITGTMKAKSISYELPATVYNQPLTLTKHRDTAGQLVWTLKRGQADQRDDEQVITGIPDAAIAAMFDALENSK